MIGEDVSSKVKSRETVPASVSLYDFTFPVQPSRV